MDIVNQIKDKLGQYITEWHKHSPKRFYLTVNKKNIVEVARILFKSLGSRFITASGVDTPLGFEIVYHFSFDKKGEIFSVRTLIPDKKHPEIDSLVPIIRGAEWIEREIWEMLGINFKNHPNLKRLLLAEDWPEGKYPLRQK